MKRALIAIATLGILASTGWVVEANAQANIDPNVYPRHMSERYGARAPANGPSRRYARRAYRRSARQTYRAQTYGAPGAPPTMYSGNTAFTPGSGPPPYAVSAQTYAAESQGPWEWHAGPGPSKRGGMCVTHTDINRGYGYQAACPPPKR